MKKKFPHYKQPGGKDCGPTCLKIIAKYYDKIIPLDEIRDLSETTRSGSNLMKLSDAAEAIGFKTLGAKLDFDNLKKCELPCIVHWNNVHFVVVYKFTRKKVHISDPSYGLISYSREEFIKRWIGVVEENKNNPHKGVVLLLETTPKFKKIEWEKNENKSIYFLLSYVKKYKSLFIQLCVGILVGSLIQLTFPFLTQSIVDFGIQNQSIDFIYLILLAQLMLFAGRVTIDVFRNWILLHLSMRINISLVSDFFIKLMQLPIAYFDTRMTGDILQRINDHSRIENLITTSTLNTLFSFFNLIVFGLVLLYYNSTIFTVFVIGSILYIAWITVFLKRRRELDYKRFTQSSAEQSSIIEIINGMQEIKMHNAEKFKRWKWEALQVKLFKISIQNLSLEQTQSVGAQTINELKNLIITFTSALLVIEGTISLGVMLAIQYIIGQLNGPITQVTGFLQAYQDAKISMERLGEIHDKDGEEQQNYLSPGNLIDDQNIIIENLSYRYPGAEKNVLENLQVVLPANKVTAIVGASGSGKTTLMKMILKFYKPNEGIISYGALNLENISPKKWRDNIGVVMQEGFIFNETIAQNIAIGTNKIDYQKLIYSTKIANIYDLVESLPYQFNTVIGNEGMGLSTGQKQRILIARAVYKNPKILCFDEATSALDSKNEKEIINNLNTFFKSRTVLIIAHRLSTVRNADNIIVMEDGKIIESGSHEQLTSMGGRYFNLVKNQLEVQNI